VAVRWSGHERRDLLSDEQRTGGFRWKWKHNHGMAQASRGTAVTATLGANFSINSLTFNSTPSSVSLTDGTGGPWTLTIKAAGSATGGLGYAAGVGIVDNAVGPVTIGVTKHRARSERVLHEQRHRRKFDFGDQQQHHRIVYGWYNGLDDLEHHGERHDAQRQSCRWTHQLG